MKFVKNNIANIDLPINSRQVIGCLQGLIFCIFVGIDFGYGDIFLSQSEKKDTIKVSKSEASWIVLSVIIVQPISVLVSGILVTYIRKKHMLILMSILEICGWLIIFWSQSVTMILIGRVIVGVFSGFGPPVIHPYLAEISHPKMRGLFLSIVLLGITLGVLCVHVLGAFFMWHVCALIIAITGVAFLVLVFYLPETYVWYLRKGYIEETKQAFYWYRGENSESKEELQKLIDSKDENISMNYTKIELLRIYGSKLLLKPLGITFIGFFTMQLSGAKAILFYSITIVSKVIPSLDQYSSSIILDIVRTVVTCIGCIVVNKCRVRPLFIISGIGSALSHFCFAAFFSYVDDSSTSQVFPILSLAALISYTVFSSIGIAHLVNLIIGELFSPLVKGVGQGISSFCNFLMLFIVVKMTPDLFECLGIQGGFLFFGVCTMVGTAIAYFILPETKNKTLKEIEDLFK